MIRRSPDTKIFVFLIFSHLLFFVLGYTLNRSVYSGGDSFVVEDVITRSGHVVGVSENGVGVVGEVVVELRRGSGRVLVSANPLVSVDLQRSVEKAVSVAEELTGKDFSKLDFVVSFNNVSSSIVSGGSGGALVSALVVCAVQNCTVNDSVVVTGTVERGGLVGEVGGVLEKMVAVGSGGFKKFVIPESQTVLNYYERVLDEEKFGGGFVFRSYRYVPRTVDLREYGFKEYNLTVVGVRSVMDVVKELEK